MHSWTYFNETHHAYSLAGSHDTGGIFRVTGSKFKVTETFSSGGIPVYGSPFSYEGTGSSAGVYTMTCDGTWRDYQGVISAISVGGNLC